MSELKYYEKYPLPKPYKTGVLFGIPVVLKLLHPKIQELINTMAKLKGCYIGIVDNDAQLYIDNQPIIKVENSSIENIKILLAEDVKVYNDITEYRLSEARKKQLLSYYI